mmetsp:Transcript_27048/g.69589  ORF Transcript_27048/g.69589 Transcript_27048/m.69589 type:complete len:494 (-) Transcript_27048:2498-3979(-)
MKQGCLSAAGKPIDPKTASLLHHAEALAEASGALRGVQPPTEDELEDATSDTLRSAVGGVFSFSELCPGRKTATPFSLSSSPVPELALNARSSCVLKSLEEELTERRKAFIRKNRGLPITAVDYATQEWLKKRKLQKSLADRLKDGTLAVSVAEKIAEVSTSLSLGHEQEAELYLKTALDTFSIDPGYAAQTCLTDSGQYSNGSRVHHALSSMNGTDLSIGKCEHMFFDLESNGGDIFARALDAAMRVFRIDSEMVQNFIELCVRDSADGDVMLQIVQSAGRASDEIVRQLVKEIKLEYQLYLSRMGMSKGRDGQHGLSSLNIESTQSPRRGYNSHGRFPAVSASSFRVSFDSETEDDKHMPSRIKLIRGRIKVSYSDVDKVLRECNDKSIDEAVEQTVNDALAKMKSEMEDDSDTESPRKDMKSKRIEHVYEVDGLPRKDSRITVWGFISGMLAAAQGKDIFGSVPWKMLVLNYKMKRTLQVCRYIPVFVCC